MKSDFLHPLEIEVLDRLVQSWNAYVKLPQLHQDEVTDFRAAIHTAQRIIMARPVLEEMGPDQSKQEQGAVRQYRVGYTTHDQFHGTLDLVHILKAYTAEDASFQVRQMHRHTNITIQSVTPFLA